MLQLQKYSVKYHRKETNKQTKNNKKKQEHLNKQTKKQANKIKKHNHNYKKHTNLHTITSKLFPLAYVTQKILSGYCSEDIYKEGLLLLPSWHHN